MTRLLLLFSYILIFDVHEVNQNKTLIKKHDIFIFLFRVNQIFALSFYL